MVPLWGFLESQLDSFDFNRDRALAFKISGETIMLHKIRSEKGGLMLESLKVQSPVAALDWRVSSSLLPVSPDAYFIIGSSYDVKRDAD
jgi:hypothetical protein